MAKTPTVWKPQHYVHATLAGIQGDASIVDIGMGRFVVVWSEADGGPIGTSPGRDIVAQIYIARGEPVGAEFQVNRAFTDNGEGQPDIAARPGGGFVVVYRDFPSSFVFSIRAETYDVNGNLVPDAPTTISEEPDDNDPDQISNPSVAIRPTGDYLVAYNRDANDDVDVVGRIVDIHGNVRGEFVIFDSGGDAARDPDVAVLSNGNYVVVFEDADSAAMGADIDPEFRIVSPTGGFVAGGVIEPGPKSVVDDVHVAALKGGGFVAVWEERNGDVNGAGIRARIYDDNGNPKGGAFTANSTTFEDQREPEVVALHDGGFVVTWDDNGFSRTYGQRFDEMGKKIGTEFIAGDLDSELRPFIGMLGDGRFVTGFDDFITEDVLATIFDPRGEVIKGTRAADVITSRADGAEVRGKKGKDILLGQKDKDLLHGGRGGDILAGDLGKDKLWGQGGKDKFVFDAALADGNVDRLKDFKHNKDKFWLDMDVFAGIGPTLSKNEFATGARAGDKSDRIIYGDQTGKVFYDVDGQGGAKKILFAKVEIGTKLDHGDFVMIAELAL